MLLSFEGKVLTEQDGRHNSVPNAAVPGLTFVESPDRQTKW